MMEFGAREAMAIKKAEGGGADDREGQWEKIWCPEDEISGLGCRWWKGHGVMG